MCSCDVCVCKIERERGREGEAGERERGRERQGREREAGERERQGREREGERGKGESMSQRGRWNNGACASPSEKATPVSSPR